MSMLARYKKQGGMIELVKLIESSAEPKRSSLLKMVRTEDAAFADEVEGKIFTFPKLKALPESVIAEIIGATPPKYLVFALSGEDPEFIKLCEKCLGKKFNEFKAEKEALEGSAISPAQIESGQRKMISEARKLEAAGGIKLAGASSSSFASPAAAAPAPGGTGPATTATPAAAAAGDALKSLAGATSAGGPPALASFGIEAPPAGLIGERLETFLKQTLGM